VAPALEIGFQAQGEGGGGEIVLEAESEGCAVAVA
jgi:hypothetical protein